jgi:vesicle-associated membrane protein 4
MNKPNTIINIKDEVEEVTNIMKDNVNKIIERDVKLNDLEDISDELNESAYTFERKANKLKKIMWWRNKKILCILIIALILFIAIVAFIITKTTK